MSDPPSDPNSQHTQAAVFLQPRPMPPPELAINGHPVSLIARTIMRPPASDQFNPGAGGG